MVKFCVKCVISRVQTLQESTVGYGDKRMSRASIYSWYELFEEGKTRVLLKEGPGAPCQQTDETVKNTCTTFIVDDDSCTLEEILQIFQRNGLHIGKGTGAFQQLPRAYG